MMVYRTSEDIKGKIDFEEPEDAEEIFYWRKHPNLHGWMEKLYRTKVGTERDFFGPIPLDKEDLEKLSEVILHKKLPFTQGFFFGTSDPDEQDRDIEFINLALQALQDGYSIYYTSDW